MKSTFVNFVDGTTAEIAADGKSWDIVWPNGKHLRGTAADAAAAERSVNTFHEQYVLVQWEKGSVSKGQQFICPLT